MEANSKPAATQRFNPDPDLGQTKCQNLWPEQSDDYDPFSAAAFSSAALR